MTLYIICSVLLVLSKMITREKIVIRISLTGDFLTVTKLYYWCVRATNASPCGEKGPSH